MDKRSSLALRAKHLFLSAMGRSGKAKLAGRGSGRDRGAGGKGRGREHGHGGGKGHGRDDPRGHGQEQGLSRKSFLGGVPPDWSAADVGEHLSQMFGKDSVKSVDRLPNQTRSGDLSFAVHWRSHKAMLHATATNHGYPRPWTMRPWGREWHSWRPGQGDDNKRPEKRPRLRATGSRQAHAHDHDDQPDQEDETWEEETWEEEDETWEEEDKDQEVEQESEVEAAAPGHAEPANPGHGPVPPKPAPSFVFSKGRFSKNEFCACTRSCMCDVYFPMYAPLFAAPRRARVYVIPTGYTHYGWKQRPQGPMEDQRDILKGALKFCNLDMPMRSAMSVCCLGSKQDEPEESRRMVKCTGFRQECQETCMSHVSGREHVLASLGHWLWRVHQFAQGHDHGPPVLQGHPKYMAQFTDKQSGHGPVDEFAVVLWCRSGRHRSVAWAALIMSVLRVYGYLPELDMSATTLKGTCEGICPACNVKPVCTEDMTMEVYQEVRKWAAHAQAVQDRNTARQSKT